MARLRLAGALWLTAGLCYLASETVAAAAFPGYSYAAHYISDLGVPYAMPGGHSALAWVMNFGGFILDGMLYAAAALIAFAAIRRHSPAAPAFLVLALLHAIGTVLVGTVHSGPREIAAGIHHYHVIGAAMAIIGGNAASIAASNLRPGFGLPAGYRRLCLALGAFGLACLAMLEMNRVAGTALLPDGVFERGSVYAITAWEIVTGLALLAKGRRR